MSDDGAISDIQTQQGDGTETVTIRENSRWQLKIARHRSGIGIVLRLIPNPHRGKERRRVVGKTYHRRVIVESGIIEPELLVVYRTASGSVNRIPTDVFLEKYRLVEEGAVWNRSHPM